MSRDLAIGVIDSGQAYTLAEFRRRCGLGDHCLREMRRAGLPVVVIGRRRYVLGSAWLAFLEQHSESQQDGG